MARVIALVNNKGGVGKTTTAVSLGAALRNRGYDVLIIDLDGQANATAALNAPTEGGTTYDTLNRPTTPYVQPARVLAPENGAGVLDVLPSCIDLSALESELATQSDRVTRFTSVAGKYREKYDAVLVDTPPTLGLLTISALYAADELIITVQPQFLAVKGLVQMRDAVDTIAGNRGEPLDARVLFTQYDRRKSMHRAAVEQVEGAGYKTFATKIRDNVALAEAPAVGVDIFRYAPRCNGAQDYTALTDEYLNAHRLRHVKHGYK